MQTWEGRDGSSTVIDGRTSPGGPHVSAPGILDAPADWDGYWQLPTDPAGLKAYYDQRTRTEPNGNNTEDQGLYYWAQTLLARPGTDATHLALATLMSQRPAVTTTTGTDDTGRPAKILTFTETHGQTIITYVDPVTGALLETNTTYANQAAAMVGIKAGGAIPQRNIYTGLGTVDSDTATR